MIWFLMTWSTGNRYSCFGKTCCLHLQGRRTRKITVWIFTAVKTSDLIHENFVICWTTEC